MKTAFVFLILTSCATVMSGADVAQTSKSAAPQVSKPAIASNGQPILKLTELPVEKPATQTKLPPNNNLRHPSMVQSDVGGPATSPKIAWARVGGAAIPVQKNSATINGTTIRRKP